MQKPFIGVTAGEITNNDYPWEPVTYGQRHTYIDAVIRAGGIPVTIPLTTDEDILRELLSRLDGILMSGGNDVSPEMYGETKRDSSRYTSKLRDTADSIALKHALANGLPVLAICRGLQLVNVYMGGTLYQNIKEDVPGALNHEHSTEVKNFEEDAHKITIDRDSKLFSIVQQEVIGTNTLHRQAIKDLGRCLKVTARSDDGIIEAIESINEESFLIGIQAHPESLHRVIPVWENVFKEFVAAASNRASLVTA